MLELAPRHRNILLGLSVELALGGTALAIGWLVGFWPGIGMGWDSPSAAEQIRGALWGLVATIPPVATLFVLDRFPIARLEEVRELAAEGAHRIFHRPQVWQLALVSAAAGVGEELAFRGLLQGGLADWLSGPAGVWIALGVSAVIFGLFHWLSATYAALATLAGLYFGVLLIATESLWTPIVAHGLYDFIALWHLIRTSDRVELPLGE